jgi:hypothetical protein
VAPRPLILEALQNPERVTGYTTARWELLVRQLRAGNLLGSYGTRLREQGLMDAVPVDLRWHFDATATLCRRHVEAVRWEVSELQQWLGQRGIPVVLLKGSAYVVGGLQAGRGRLFFDVDILVPEHALEETEGVLRKAGWLTTHVNEYDQRYYRKWSHELPPMQHRLRGTVLDVHHTIVPPTARVRPDARKLLADAVPVDGLEEIYTLSPVDMLLHSAGHLFYNGELEQGLRDLVDLDNLITEFSQEAGFWERLLQRAQEQQLTQPLYYALRYCSAMLGSGIPEEVITRAQVAYGGHGKSLLDFCYRRALLPDHASCNDRWTALARWLLYVRAHYQRMPLYLLLPHLLYKGTLAKYREPGEPENAEQIERIFGHLK